MRLSPERQQPHLLPSLVGCPPSALETNISFSLLPPLPPISYVSNLLQEKRKRDAGQQNKGKNYIEEEKRKARDFGIYSGFD